VTASFLRRAVKVGLIGGIVVGYLGAVGMIEKFSVRNLVGTSLTMGRLMMVLPGFLAGYAVVSPRISRGRTEQLRLPAALMVGGLAGAVAGGLTAAEVALVHALHPDAVRGIFVAVSPKLLSILTFGRSLPLAAVILAAGGASLGAAGGGMRLLQPTYRRSLFTGVFATVSVGLLQLIVPPILRQLRLSPDWLYSPFTHGLTYGGAIIVFVTSAAISLSWGIGEHRVRRRVDQMPAAGRRSIALLGFAALLGVLAVFPLLVGPVLSQILGTVGIFLLMGLGLNIVVGYAGLLDLGYVAFFAAGAYLTALLTGAAVASPLGLIHPVLPFHLSFYMAVPVVVLVAAFIGILIGAPVLRLRGDYLAIVTLGFGEIARVLVSSDWLRRILGGAEGLQGITPAPIGGVSFQHPEPFYYLVLGFCLLAVYVSYRLADSRIGRAWVAMREDEQVAEAMGISTVRYKLLAFAIGASVGCVSGALFAVQIGSLAPVSFNILISITALSVIILGGMGSIPGVIVGALVLIGLPQLLDEFEEFRLLIYGAVLIAIMILRPQGLLPNVRRTRELHEEEMQQDAWGEQAPVATPEAEIGEASITVEGRGT
jgi:branched-chain amino acid transport system permease protein